ncbi:hypothetical protein TrVGV298_007192 [Trichoderma virens]|nr:hypothetical protein TrVGV298_007192 [Trichoderma virens]
MAPNTNNDCSTLPELASAESLPDVDLESPHLLEDDMPESPNKRPASDASDHPTITPPLPSAENAQQNGIQGESCEIPQKSSSQEPSTVKWVIGWRFPVLVLSTFLTGILVDVAHHIYYQSLENTPVQSSNQQVWAIRIGSGLAFLNKTCLVAVMGMVATQQIWFTVRRKFITLRGIDNMFKLMNDPTAIFNRDLLTRAKTLVLLASLSWLVPLIAVVTPATLSVRISLETTTIPTIVPTVSFGNYFNWVLRTTADVGPSADISRLFSATCSSVSYLPLAAPFPNSSYELSYWAPTYKCGNLDEFLAELISPSWERWNWMLDPDPSSFKEAWDEEIKLQPDHAYLAVIPERTPNAFFIWAAGTGSGSGNSSNGTKILPFVREHNHRWGG